MTADSKTKPFYPRLSVQNQSVLQRHHPLPIIRMQMAADPRLKLLSASICILLLTVRAYGQSTGRLSGAVIEESSLPISAAYVQISHRYGEPILQQTQTHSDGTFELTDVPVGTYDLAIRSPGLPTFVREGLRVPAGETLSLGSITLQYEPPSCGPGVSSLPKIEIGPLAGGETKVVGSVVKSDDPQPLARARVVVLRGKKIIERTKTDSQGTFSWEGLLTGSYSLRVFAFGYSDFIVDAVPIKPGQETRIESLEMRRCAKEARCAPTKYNVSLVLCQ